MTAQHETRASTAGANAGSSAGRAERLLRHEFTVNAPASAVWRAWSSTAGLQSFLAAKANVELAIGGAYEVFFDPSDERFSTKGCKLMSYVPQEMISFQWTLPRDMFPELAGSPTWVVVQLRPAGADRTEVSITQLGWGTGENWDRAYDHMPAGWQMVAKQLEQRFESGPIDWEAQRQLWEERRRESR
jgi:uncharacterized protein YndB with AHSA1/START domain